jgi:hypothetical protein
MCQDSPLARTSFGQPCVLFGDPRVESAFGLMQPEQFIRDERTRAIVLDKDL